MVCTRLVWLCVCILSWQIFLHWHTCQIYLHRHNSETVKFSKANAWLYTSSGNLKKYGCLIGNLTCLGEIEAAVCTIRWRGLPSVNQWNVAIVNLQPDRIINITTNKIMFAKFLWVLEIRCWCNLDPPPAPTPQSFL